MEKIGGDAGSKWNTVHSMTGRQVLLRLISSRIACMAIVALAVASAGCKAQNSAATSTIQDPALARSIEVMVRSQFNVPPDFEITLGARTPSEIPGYDKLLVTLGRNGRTTSTSFLLSKDNKTLARLETFDLAGMPTRHIPISGRPVRGNADAKVTVISFDDLECPFCAAMHRELFPETINHYGNLVRFVYKDDPLVEIHPWAMHAAVDANCLAAQNGKAYWNYVDYLHAHGDEVTGTEHNLQKSFATLDRIARDQVAPYKLQSATLDACLSKQDETTIRESMHEADALGVDGTPSLFIDGEHINGAVPASQVWLVIDRALRAAGVQPPPESAASGPAGSGAATSGSAPSGH